MFGTILVLILPVAPFMLDLLLTVSIAASLLTLLVILYLRTPAEFTGFPTLLLFITLYRLALNVASTRLILLNGYAGHIIQAFGNFVVHGNYVVGMVVFLILVLINFIVITKGAGRIAEVAARFTLDAMPGKQMAIDAELNAGLINETEARNRRRAVEEEADFYGAMDGASKFVRGDAIAAILITLINIVGGFAIGIVQKGMTMSEALQRFTILSIGDGLVSQIPALITSTAAGILITRATSKNNLGHELGRQLLFYPRALTILAAMLGVMALVPGLPMLPFLTLAAIIGLLSYSHARARDAGIVRRGFTRPPPARMRAAKPATAKAGAGAGAAGGRSRSRRQTGKSAHAGHAANRAGLSVWFRLADTQQRRRSAGARHRRAAKFCVGNGRAGSADPAARQFAVGHERIPVSAEGQSHCAGPAHAAATGWR